MAVGLLRMLLRPSIRNARSEAGMRPSSIVMSDPLTKDAPQLVLVQQDHEVQTLAAYGAYQPFAECVRCRGAHRRLKHRQTHRHQRPIDVLGVNRVPIMNHESVRLVTCDDHPTLLRGPFGRWMRRHVAVQDSSRADLQDDEHVHHTEHGRHDHEKSHAITVCAWFRMKVVHARVSCLPRGGLHGMYRMTVRGES